MRIATATAAMTTHRGRPLLPDNPTKAQLEAFVDLSLAAGHASTHPRLDRGEERVRLYRIGLRFVESQVAEGAAVESDEPIAAAILAALRAEYVGQEVPWALVNLANDTARAAFAQHRYALRRARELAAAAAAMVSDDVVDFAGERRAADEAHASAEEGQAA